MKPLRLQTRIAAASAAIICLGLLACCLAAVFIIRGEGLDQLDDELEAESSHFVDEWYHHGGPAKYDLRGKMGSMREWLPSGHPNRLAEVTYVDGEPLYRSAGLQGISLANLPAGTVSVSFNGRDWRVLSLEHKGVWIRIVASLQPLQLLLGTLVASLILVAPVLLLVAVVSGRWVAWKTLEPVRRIAQVAERITARQLEERVPVPGPEDEVRRLALVLNATLERLQRSFEQAQRFSADASHELKTPLTVMRASIESILQSPTLAAADQEAVGGLLEQAQRLTSITQSLLLLSRADAGRLRLDIQPTNITELVQGCVEDASIMADAQGITIEAEIPTELTVAVDRVRLSQIVVNLLDNAVKYNCPCGRVRVVVERTAECLEISVANTGHTIPQEQAEHIFKRFHRSQHVESTPGHGLGLSLSRELARAHDGTLKLVSSVAGWTQFCLSVPADLPTTRKAAAPASEAVAV